MKNLKNILLTLIIFISAPLAGAQRPPQPPKLPTYGQLVGEQEKDERSERIMQELEKSSQQALQKSRMQAMASLHGLPEPLQKMVLHFLATPGTYKKIQELAQCIIALAETDKAMRAVMNDPKNILLILNAMPYTANAVSLFELLQSKSGSLPVMRSTELQHWFAETGKLKLKNGSTLWKYAFDAIAQHAARTEQENLKEVLTLLKEKDIDLNYRPTFLTTFAVLPTPLHAAVNSGYINIVRVLLAAGTNPNSKIDRDGTPLMSAADQENLEMVELLLAAGADPEPENSEGQTALAIALNKNNVAIAARIEQALPKASKEEEKPAKRCAIQ